MRDILLGTLLSWSFAKKRSFEQGIMAGVTGLKIAPRALFHPKIIRIGAMAGTVNRNRKVKII